MYIHLLYHRIDPAIGRRAPPRVPHVASAPPSRPISSPPPCGATCSRSVRRSGDVAFAGRQQPLSANLALCTHTPFMCMLFAAAIAGEQRSRVAEPTPSPSCRPPSRAPCWRWLPDDIPRPRQRPRSAELTEFRPDFRPADRNCLRLRTDIKILIGKNPRLSL